MDEEELLDLLVRHAVYLERLKAGEVRRFDPALRALDRTVRELLTDAGDAPSQRALGRVLRELATRGKRSNAVYLTQLRDSLKGLSAYASEFHDETLRLAGTVAQVRAMLSPEAAAVWKAVLQRPLQSTGDLLEPFLDGWSQRALLRMERTIRVGYAQGLSVAQIVAQLRGTAEQHYRDGQLGSITKREADAMVRTAIAHVNSAAQMEVYRQNADMLDGYQWVSILDSRTSATCRSLDGRIFKLGKGPVPPIHVNCRSGTLPVVKGMTRRKGLRPAEGPYGEHNVRAHTTYYEWLKRQPKYFQIDALGPTRAELFRNGGLTPQEFADLQLDKNFQPLTLEQMRRKNPAAFMRAGLE